MSAAVVPGAKFEAWRTKGPLAPFIEIPPLVLVVALVMARVCWREGCDGMMLVLAPLLISFAIRLARAF